MITNRYSINLVTSRGVQNFRYRSIIDHCAFDNGSVSTYNILTRKYVCCCCSNASNILICIRYCGNSNFTENLPCGRSNVLCLLCRSYRLLFESYRNGTLTIVYTRGHCVRLIACGCVKFFRDCTIICKSTSCSRTIRLNKYLVCANVSFFNCNSANILIVFRYGFNRYGRKTIMARIRCY